MTELSKPQLVNLIIEEHMNHHEGWDAETRDRAIIGMTSALIHSGLSDVDRDIICQCMIDHGYIGGFEFPNLKSTADYWYNYFIPQRDRIEQERRNKEALSKIEPDIDALREIITNYDAAKADGELTIDAIREAAPHIYSKAEAIHNTLTPKGVDIRAILRPRTMAEIIDKIRNKPDAIETGYSINDDPLRFQTGAFSIIAAPTGHGKTTFMNNLLLDIANRYPQKRHWLFSYEEDDAAIHIKILNTLCNYKFSRKNKLTIDEHYKGSNTAFDAFPEAYSVFRQGEVKFWRLVESGRLNVVQADYSFDDLVSTIRAVSSDNCGAVMIDYIQLLYMANSGGLPRAEELKQICLKLKDIAIETGLAIIAAGQFNREVLRPSDMMPQKLSDASDIEKAANKIVGLWNGGKRGKLAVSELDSKGITREMMLLRVLKARDEESDIEAIYNWNGNLGVVGKEEIRWNDPRRQRGKADSCESEVKPAKQKRGNGNGKVSQILEGMLL